jgi:Putative beta-lactamase-inhibitor-like, PepSY-like
MTLKKANYNLKYVFMKKMLYCLLISGSVFMAGSAAAQFRSIPGVVTDSFRLKYPDAKTVNWSDNLSSFQATFMMGNEKYVAKYNSKGEWQSSQKTIKQEDLPAAVKDGFTKSKYSGDWKIYTVTVRYLPRDFTNYILRIGKGDISRKNLLFASDGQLLKDGTTL